MAAPPAMDIYIPPSMSYFVKRLSGVTMNTVKLTNLSNTTASAGDTIRLRFPNNAIINLSSLTLYAKATTTVTTPDNHCVLPKLTQSLINQVRININGQTVSGGSLNDYGILYNIGSRCQQAPHHIKMLNLMHSGSDVPTPTACLANVPIAIDDWFGFLSCMPHYFHTGIVGEMIMEIVLAPNTVLACSSAALAASYSLSNIYANIEVLQFDNDMYSKILEMKLANGETLEISYNDAYSFFKPKSTTIEAQVSSNAITKVFTVPRVDNSTGSTARQYTITNIPVLGVGQYHLFDTGEGDHNTSEANITTACVAAFADSTKTMQWSVDNRLIPTNPAPLPECYQMLCDMFGDRASTSSSHSILQEPYELLPWTTVFPIVAPATSIVTASAIGEGGVLTNGKIMAQAFPTDTMIYRKLNPAYVYLRKNAIFGLNLELNETGDQRLISGFNSIGKNCVIRCDLSKIIAGTLSAKVDLLMFVLVKKCLKIRAGQQIFVDI